MAEPIWLTIRIIGALAVVYVTFHAGRFYERVTWVAQEEQARQKNDACPPSRGQ
jgi:hypothetical protein